MPLVKKPGPRNTNRDGGSDKTGQATVTRGPSVAHHNASSHRWYGCFACKWSKRSERQSCGNPYAASKRAAFKPAIADCLALVAWAAVAYLLVVACMGSIHTQYRQVTATPAGQTA